jgi:nucleoid-associated protein YgaU
VLKRLDGGGELEVHYNPTQLAIQKSSAWTDTPARGAASAPRPEFVGAQARTLTLTLLLDGSDGKHDVAKDAETLQSWCNPTPESLTRGTPQPPLVQLEWASPALFDAYLSTVNVTYTLFDRDGTPLRANVDVTLRESPRAAAGQNPSSGAPPGHGTHVLAAGDSLQAIAHREYGEAALWRGLARYNRIADPLRVRPGTRLDLPPAARVRELAR